MQRYCGTMAHTFPLKLKMMPIVPITQTANFMATLLYYSKLIQQSLLQIVLLMLPNAKFSAAELKSIFELEFTDLLYLDLQQIYGP